MSEYESTPTYESTPDDPWDEPQPGPPEPEPEPPEFEARDVSIPAALALLRDLDPEDVGRRPWVAEVVRLKGILAAVQATVVDAREDLDYHASREDEQPDYRTPHGWRNVSDLLDDVDRAVGTVQQ